MTKHELSNCLNEKIVEIEELYSKYNYEVYPSSGKIIPYFGWFWREYPFYLDKYYLSIDKNGYIGFDVSDKFNLEYIFLNEEESEKILELVICMCDNPCINTFKQLNDYIQSFNTKNLKT